MTIKLKREDNIGQDSNVLNKDIFKDHIVIHRDFDCEVMDKVTFAEFQKIVNRHRPYSSFDFVPQTFMPNLSRERGC